MDNFSTLFFIILFAGLSSARKENGFLSTHFGTGEEA